MATDYYMTTTGAGVKDGLTWAKAFSLVEFEAWMETTCVLGDRCFVMEGTYTFTQDLLTTRDGSDAQAPIEVIGVVTGTTAEPPTTADWASGANRPLFAAGAWDYSHDNYWNWKNLRVTSTNDPAWDGDLGCTWHHCTVTQTGAGADGFNGTEGCKFVSCDGSSTTGTVFVAAADAITFIGCYAHDSDRGFQYADGTVCVFCIADTMVDEGFYPNSLDYTATINCTAYNCAEGVYVLASGGQCRTCIILNCILDSCNYGIVATTNSISMGVVDYNNYWNSGTADTSTQVKGPNATAVDPEFENAVGGDFSLDATSACIGAGFAIELGV